MTNIVDKITDIKQATLDHYQNSITRSRYVSDINKVREMVKKECLKKEPSTPDFILLNKLFETYVPKQRGFISTEEKQLIIDMLELSGRSIINLRNLRNTVVMLVDIREKAADCDIAMEIDRMSAITHIIDMELFKLGAEI